MARPKGSKNRIRIESFEELPITPENFLKLQAIRADYLSRIDGLKAEIAKLDKSMLRFADWMEGEAKRLRQQAKG